MAAHTDGRWRRSCGFTLAECLAAAGVSLVAVALAAVGVAATRAQSMAEQCRANLATIGAAAAQYTADHQGWIVGSPATSGRELLNDGRAVNSGFALEVNGDATQPHDWAGPLAWSYLAPDSPRPARRDERFAALNGTEIPDYMNPDFDPGNIDMTPDEGPLGILADPAQRETSLPYVDYYYDVRQTAFVPELAMSYTSAREFLWWIQGSAAGGALTPRWASDAYWGSRTAVLQPRLPTGMIRPPYDEQTGYQPAYRPFIDRIGAPSQKVFLADGTKYQMAQVQGIDHDISSSAGYGGAFSDTGAWDVSNTRAWPLGLSVTGRDMTGTSLRHGSSPSEHIGNFLFFDGSVRTLTGDQSRRPELWMPRGTLIPPNSIWGPIRDKYPHDIPGTGRLNLGALVRLP